MTTERSMTSAGALATILTLTAAGGIGCTDVSNPEEEAISAIGPTPVGDEVPEPVDAWTQFVRRLLGNTPYGQSWEARVDGVPFWAAGEDLPAPGQTGPFEFQSGDGPLDLEILRVEDATIRFYDAYPNLIPKGTALELSIFFVDFEVNATPVHALMLRAHSTAVGGLEGLIFPLAEIPPTPTGLTTSSGPRPPECVGTPPCPQPADPECQKKLRSPLEFDCLLARCDRRDLCVDYETRRQFLCRRAGWDYASIRICKDLAIKECWNALAENTIEMLS